MPNKLVLVGIFLLATGLDTATARSPISLDVLRRDGYGSVQLVRGGENRLFVPAEINGKKFKLLLDTGFGVDGIAVGGSAGELNLTPMKEKKRTIVETAGGSVMGMESGMAQSVLLGNVHIQGAPIYLYNGSGGVLGRSFLHTNSAIVDLTNLTLYLRPPRTGKGVDLGRALTSLGMGEAPFAGLDGGTYVMNVEVNNVPARVILDTGAQMTVLDSRFAKQAKMRGWDRRNYEIIDAVGGHSSLDFAGPTSFKVGGILIRTPTITLTNLPFYSESKGKIVGVLGLDVLGLNWSIIDFGQNRLYFAKAN